MRELELDLKLVNIRMDEQSSLKCYVQQQVDVAYH